MAEHTCQEQGESSAQSSNCLQWQSILVRSRVSLQLKPVPTLAPLGCPLAEPHPLDVCVLLVAHASHHTVVVHSIHNVRLILSALAPCNGLQEERVQISRLFCQQLVLLQTSGVLHTVGHHLVSVPHGGQMDQPAGGTAPSQVGAHLVHGARE